MKSLILEQFVSNPYLLHHDLKYADDFNDVFTRNNTCQRVVAMQLSRRVTIKDMTVEMDNLSVAQRLKRVYTGKKKSSAVASTRKFEVSSAASIMLRDLRDSFISKTSKVLCHSGTFQMSSAMDKPHKNDNFGAGCGVGDQLIVSLMEKSAINLNPLVERMSSFVSVTQTSYFSSKGKDDSNLLEVPISPVEKLQDYYEDMLVETQNILNANSLVLSLEHCTTFSCGDSSTTKEIQANSNNGLQRNLELNYELGGMGELMECYSHQIPVLCLLLVAKGDGIYVCALSESLVDQNRALFLYKLAIEVTRIDCPSFVDHHTPVNLATDISSFLTDKLLVLDENGFDGELKNVKRIGLVYVTDDKEWYCKNVINFMLDSEEDGEGGIDLGVLKSEALAECMFGADRKHQKAHFREGMKVFGHFGMLHLLFNKYPKYPSFSPTSIKHQIYDNAFVVDEPPDL